MESRTVQAFGNSGHIVLPKEYVGRKVKFLLETKSFEDIKSDVLEILKPYSENVLGVYLYGSYARNEQTVNSDVDILVIVNGPVKIKSINDYSFIAITLEELEETINRNAVLVIPLLKEAKTIINPRLLEVYKEHKFTKKNTKLFLESCKDVINLNKKGIELDFDIGSIVYSLILRTRALFMIKVIMKNGSYSKSDFFEFLENKGVANVNELYDIYSKEREGIKVKESKIVNKEVLRKLLGIAEKLLSELK